MYTLQSPLYKQMNADLDGGVWNTKFRSYINALRRALLLDSIPTFRGICYRSLTLSVEDIECYKKLEKGDLICWHAFSSCTKNLAIARGWGGNVMIIDCNVESPAILPRDICAISAFPHEQEVLLLNNSKLEMVKMEKTDLWTKWSSSVQWELHLKLYAFEDARLKSKLVQAVLCLVQVFFEALLYCHKYYFCSARKCEHCSSIARQALK